MHLRRLHIENFKGIRSLDVEFLRDDATPRPLTLLLGANGSGKTSVLQAIALVLALATYKIAEPSHFRWPGFLLERTSSGGPTSIELELGFADDELAATRDLFAEWLNVIRPNAVVAQPATTQVIRLIYKDGTLVCEQGAAALAQCFGRFYLRTLLRSHPQLRPRFRDVGDVFWFDQHRNLFNASGDAPGLEGIRQYLITLYAYHKSPRRPGPTTQEVSQDYLGRLEATFARLFPGTRFAGVEPRPGLTTASVADSYFLLQRDGRTYDVAEMSSGEQVIFSLIYEFIRFDIARSIILIDELELHLHPPQQQTLLAALRTIGPDCQFIITSHSPYLESAVPDDEEIRLEGGLRCL